MKSFLKYLCIGSTMALMLPGCSDNASSGGDPSGGNPKIAIGVFVDVPVQGLDYTSGSKSGITGIGGTFTYQNGDQVVLKMGDIVIGKSIGAPAITLTDLAKAANPLLNDGVAESRAVKLAQFLLTFDDGTKVGSINIPSTIMDDARGMRFEAVDLLNDNLDFLVSTIKLGASLADPAIAANYLADSQIKRGIRIHAGEYMFTDSNDGTEVELNIQPDGSVVGIANRPADGGIYQLNGSVEQGGDLKITVMDYETRQPVNIGVIAKSDGTGRVSGSLFTPKAPATGGTAEHEEMNASAYSLQRVVTINNKSGLTILKPD